MLRVLTLVYGLASYLLFLATFLYAIGFVAGVGVPKHIDNGASAPPALAAAVNCMLLGLFAAQHSIMARPAFKRWWTRFVPHQMERSTYVLFSSLALVALFALWMPLPTLVWELDHPVARWTMHGIAAAGWLLVLTGTFLISHFDLFGLRQVWLHARGKIAADTPFVVRAYYRVVRHPLMLGFIVAFWATPRMTVGHLMFALITTAYIVLAVKFLEERDLVAAYGDTYRDYQRKVPMIMPGLRLRG